MKYAGKKYLRIVGIGESFNDGVGVTGSVVNKILVWIGNVQI